MFELFIGEIIGDFKFVLMIFTFITIASFVRNHLGTGPAAWMIIIVVAGIVFFSGAWGFFGGMFVIYMLLMFGISTLMIDFFFVAPRPGAKQQSPMGSGADLGARVKQMQQQRGSFAQRFRGR